MTELIRRGDCTRTKAAPLQGADRIGLATCRAVGLAEAEARQRSTKKGPLARPFLQIKNKRQTATPAPRSNHLAPPDAATATLPGDYQPGSKGSAEADSTTCRC
jgi:hypothetical protein